MCSFTTNANDMALETPHKQLPATRPHRDNLCMRASRASEENCHISAFKTCYFFHYFCWYFNREILGDCNTGHPPPKILGRYIPHASPRDRHPCVCVHGGHFHIEGDGDVPLDRVCFRGHQY